MRCLVTETVARVAAQLVRTANSTKTEKKCDSEFKKRELEN